ncbi:hypothetical protein BC835DRAFT_99562 [Cytidiella melzeri]|nr:hypothetical protein BC835DRAFT_99562 [Cytidiella melzeri]
MVFLPEPQSQASQITISLQTLAQSRDAAHVGNLEDEIESLARTLKAVATLGRTIRHLRLEGGYERHLNVVAQHAPNVTVLSLQIKSLSRLPSTGLLHAMPSFSTTKVYLRGFDRQVEKKKSQANAHKITAAMGTWKSLLTPLPVIWELVALPGYECHSWKICPLRTGLWRRYTRDSDRPT